MDKINFGGFQFGASLEGEEPRSPGDPFRILLIGDFGGDNQNASPTPAKIDRDTLDEVMSSIAPRVDRLLTTFDGLPIAFNPTSLDDFHPDQLFESMDIFAEMRKLKRQLKNPNLFAAAAETILGWEVIRDSTPEAEATPTDSSPPSEEMNPDYSTEGLFDSVLESSADQSDETDWNGMIGDIISSSKIQKVDPRVDELTEIVDKVTERLMQSILFQSGFRALEANWRSVDRLVRSVETSGQLQIYILDLSATALRNDLDAESLQASHLNRLLVEQTVKTPGADPWSVVGCMFDFDSSEDDVNALGRLSQLAAAGQFNLVVGADADEETWDSDEAKQNWQPLRSISGTSHLCVVWPKYLFRLPYGAKHGRVDTFAFEELAPGAPEPWATATPVVAICLAQQFQEQKWNLDTAGTLKLGGLPMFYREDEDENQAPGQYLLTETLGNRIRAEFGITPMYSVRDTDEVLFSGIGSVGGKALY